jgi:hypothetical protein
MLLQVMSTRVDYICIFVTTGSAVLPKELSAISSAPMLLQVMSTRVDYICIFVTAGSAVLLK